ncbi:hypothetical protein CSH63_17705 [Micromonospora tulbaghiae]|uniref:Uncharacterized protein n=1 Tax=Micromonospora tulbaghiae TaxID=479978 RepID=A0A386WLN5_9ACTN|nr:helix-turn-helix domain-containing protein [Micromonospora tulbaghiae]AYF29267.1 hypothetical protein CSH63_17705 [Micromonospora tulbaghiae]
MTELATQELAQARAARIRAGIGAYVATLDDIAAAYAQRDWSALGYESWQAYVDGEYGEQRLRLTPERRQEAVGALRLAGMSQRAIGSALGISHTEVGRQLRSGGTNVPPDAEIQGADGKQYAATRPEIRHPGSESTQSPASTPEPDPEASTSTGSGPHIPDRQDPDPAPGSATPDGPADHPQSRAGATVPVAGPAVDPTTPGVGGAIDAEVRGSAEKGDPVGSAVSPPPAPTAPTFDQVLDRLVPDPNPHREWQGHFLKAISAANRLMLYTPDAVAEKADEQCLEELARLARNWADWRARVLQAVADTTPDNVTPLRRTS